MPNSKTSSAGCRAKYLRNDFFKIFPDMIFWENDRYTEKAKERLRKIADTKISSSSIKRKA